MIPNQWYAILESSEVRSGRPVGVTRLGERLVLWRSKDGVVHALRDRCAHRGAALSLGCLKEGRVQCPFHGFEYDGSGQCRRIPGNGRDAPVPATIRVAGYPLRESHGLIWLWWGEPRSELPALPFFADIDESFPYATLRDHWSVHYSRAIENQLDVLHLPFVHHNTIGRGGRTLVNGPLVRTESDTLHVWVYNTKDEGQAPLRPEELPEPARLPLLHFHFPNVWQNRIAENLRIVACFAPIDEENTMVYVRFYQRAVTFPLLRQLVCWLGRTGNGVVLRQDKRVVVTQQPKKSALKMGEKLVQGDRPIVAYRMRRQDLLDAAGTAPQSMD